MLVPGTTPQLRARTAGGRRRIQSTSPVAPVRGAARTLDAQGSLLVSWEGMRDRPLARRDGNDGGGAAEIRDWHARWLKDGRIWPRRRRAAPLALARTLLAESDA